ncbi:hypothetical protein PG984_004601 [Apiospora sp. TS-2023a]
MAESDWASPLVVVLDTIHFIRGDHCVFRPAIEVANGDQRPFPNIPTELRLGIWQMSFSERLVCLREIKSSQPPVISDAFSPLAGEQSFINIYTSPTPNPAQLYACRESRAEALKEYQPFFGACIFFSSGRDIAYFARGGSSDDMLFSRVGGILRFSRNITDQLAQVRSLALDADAVWRLTCAAGPIGRLPNMAMFLASVYSVTPSLARLVFVRRCDGEELCSFGEECTFVAKPDHEYQRFIQLVHLALAYLVPVHGGVSDALCSRPPSVYAPPRSIMITGAPQLQHSEDFMGHSDADDQRAQLHKAA